ncbi:ferritin-like domain-containing protein [Akkermansiaceae bacterium]|nr:ferritin-like domain-containing protein [Akkermansiaceae bacterium]
MDPPQRGSYRSPDLPGRPTELRPVKTKSNNRFPSAEQLEDEEQRALLLHFFANHELLAVELMALALLKFPDAPDSFRKGVLHTLQEEQNHTRWYMQRMKECGITFGDIQVSPMIWEHIADMESPLDYVSRLSLTFEQANLDYAKHYSQLLGQAGDTKSAKILDKVYHDEIAHVGHGLKWLRRWKENAQSDWDAWHKRLHIPLSPMRAKGMAPFNEEGRRKAGLNEEFIATLKRYQSSRGRSPDICFFNPFAEVEQSDPSWNCPKKLDQLAADLEPAFALAAPTQDDIVLLRRPVSDQHRDQLARFGLTFPEVGLLSEIKQIKKTRKIGSIRPWANKSPLLSKTATQDLRNRLPEELTPLPSQICEGNITEFISKHSHQNWVAKALDGAAGRGLHRFTKETLDRLPKRPLLVEPWVEKLHEFSFLLHRSPEAEGGLRFLSIVHQKTSADGQWKSSESRAKHSQGLPSDQAQLLNRHVFPTLKEQVIPALETLLAEHDFLGPLCIDSFFYADEKDELAWQPVVELNTRWTMGRIAYQLRLKLAPQGNVTLSTCSPEEARELSSPRQENDHFREGSIALGDPETSAARVPIINIS